MFNTDFKQLIQNINKHPYSFYLVKMDTESTQVDEIYRILNYAQIDFTRIAEGWVASVTDMIDCPYPKWIIGWRRIIDNLDNKEDGGSASGQSEDN
jgi:hypothetical protein